MKITYIGHSCFEVESEGFRVIIDPYQEESVPGLTDVDREVEHVLNTHWHEDHAGSKTVKLNAGKNDPFTITVVKSFHDPEQGKLRGFNDIMVLEAEGKKVVHMGDVGCPLDEIEGRDILKGADLMMMPIGGVYTVDPAEATEMIKQLEPKKVVPMHFFSGTADYDDLATFEDFEKVYDGKSEVVKMGQLRKGDAAKETFVTL